MPIISFPEALFYWVLGISCLATILASRAHCAYPCYRHVSAFGRRAVGEAVVYDDVVYDDACSLPDEIDKVPLIALFRLLKT